MYISQFKNNLFPERNEFYIYLNINNLLTFMMYLCNIQRQSGRKDSFVHENSKSKSEINIKH